MADDRKFMQRVREQFKLDCEQERKIRAEALTDLTFVSGEGQWHDGIRREREEEGRPCLTFNKLHTYIQNVANEARQNKPQGKVNPVSGGADIDTANVINGITRHIQYRSQADVAGDTALEYSASCSFAFIRYVTEYGTDKAHPFDQEIRILSVDDPFSIYGILMPACRGEEPEHAFIIKRIPREKYKEEYGDIDKASDFEALEWKDCDDWLDDKSVRIAEYYWRVKSKRRVREIQAPDGSTAPVYDKIGGKPNPMWDQPHNWVMEDVDEDDPTAIPEPREREEDTYKVKWCLVDGRRKLPGTETTLIDDTLPIVPVLGRKMIVDGEVKLFSLVRFVREPQQLINIYKTAIAEKIALANRVPYIGYKGQFKDPKWIDANRKNYAFLEAELVYDKNGNLIPAPQRQQLEEQIQALSLAVAQEIDDLKSGMGIFDASLGQKSNETSGIAQQRRQAQANVTNLHFMDNLMRAEWALERKLLRVIPKIYDRPGRQVRIVGEDLAQSVVVVNKPHIDPETGREKHFALDVGEYDVVVTVGPSYTTARQEAAETLSQFFQAAPNTIPLIGDLWASNLDYPWAQEAARRLKAAAPQNIVNKPEDQGVPIPPQVAQQMAAMQEQLQKTTAFAQSLHEQLATKQPEIQSTERIAMAKIKFEEKKLATQSETELAKLGIMTDIERLKQDIDILKHQSGLNATAQMKQADRDHQLTVQGQQQAHEADQTAQNQQFEAEQAEKEPAETE